MTETPLAALVPLWVTLREAGVTALVTPAGRYVGALQVGTLDVRYAAEEARERVGEALRALVSGLDEGTVLQFLAHAETDLAPLADAYARGAEGVAGALAAHVEARAGWLRAQRGRRVSLFLFFSAPERGLFKGERRAAGGRVLFKLRAGLTEARQREELHRLVRLRDRLAGELSALGATARELDVDEVRRIQFELLNPGRAAAGARPTRVALREDLWSEATLRAEGDHLREYTEAEELCHEDLEDRRGHLLHGGRYRRVCTLKLLPEDGTEPFAAAPLTGLALREGDEARPFPCWLAVTVEVRPQAAARWRLNQEHRLVRFARTLAERVRDESVDAEEADLAREGSLRGLFAELHAMSSKVVALSVTLLMEAETLEALDAETEAARRAFAASGNAELLQEEVTQVPAFLAMLPGAGAHQLRRKGATSRNAADYLPLFSAWRGSLRPMSVGLTPEGDAVAVDLFDRALASAHHGLMVGDTGSGKSLGMGLFVLEALAAGVDCVLVDNGGSWRLLTELVGGTHVEVDLRTSISPFLAAGEVCSGGAIEPEALESVVVFLELCLADRDLPAFGKLQRDVLARAIAGLYARLLAEEPDRAPLVGEFREALLAHPFDDPEDRAIAKDLARRLRIYCDGLYAEFLNRPSPLRLDAALTTLDLQAVSQDEATKQVAMAVVMQLLAARARRRCRRTLVLVDEGHQYLGRGDVAERFLENAYRQFRKLDTAVWMLTQQFADFAASRAADAIIGNSAQKAFLQQSAGRDAIAERFRFTPGLRRALDGLARRPGYYSDLLLVQGEHATVLRHAPHPLAYWILTTDPDDRAVRERALAHAGGASPLEVLQGLAVRFPHGAVGTRTRSLDRTTREAREAR